MMGGIVGAQQFSRKLKNGKAITLIGWSETGSA
jgi:hypothetical protein